MNSAKLQNLFHIDEYNVYDDEIEVFLLKDGQEKTIFISREKFEKWLKEDNRLDWVFDCADTMGEHYQETGTMPVESYYEACTIDEVKTDLYDYIIKKMDCKKFFELDVCDLQRTHPPLYNKIKLKMERKAKDYWNAPQIEEIPTLAYQKVLKNQMDMITKALFLVVILLTSFTSFSQAFVDFGGGVAKVTKASKVPDCVVPVMKISAGYHFGNIVTEAVLQPSITRETNTPSYIGLKAGYNIYGFIPSIGALYNYRNADDVTMNRWEVGYALKYQFPVGPNGGLYAEALYTKSSYQLTGGFNIQF